MVFENLNTIKIASSASAFLQGERANQSIQDCIANGIGKLGSLRIHERAQTCGPCKGLVHGFGTSPSLRHLCDLYSGIDPFLTGFLCAPRAFGRKNPGRQSAFAGSQDPSINRPPTSRSLLRDIGMYSLFLWRLERLSELAEQSGKTFVQIWSYEKLSLLLEQPSSGTTQEVEIYEQDLELLVLGRRRNTLTNF